MSLLSNPSLLSQQQSTPSNYSQSLSKSLTIDEMRDLHRQALTEAESKKTELRLVLASRYRELVGSSDEVSTMSRDASVLQDLVCQLPSLVDDLISCVHGDKSMQDAGEAEMKKQESIDDAHDDVMADRLELSVSPRIIHSYLDQKNVHGATSALIGAFEIIAKYTEKYQLVNEIISNGKASSIITIPPNSLSSQDAKVLFTQIKMVYFHLQTLPLYTIQLSKQILVSSSDKSENENDLNHAHDTARSLSALHRLNVSFFKYNDSTRANKLLDLYFDSKAKTIHSLLEKLSSNSINKKSNLNDDITKGRMTTLSDTVDDTDVAERIISEIISILQYDIILYPYQIFMLRKYAVDNDTNSNLDDVDSVDDVIKKLPIFDQEQVKTKSSNFLAAHLPLIRTKVKAVLVGIAGTTASRLGSIRQSLYDKTDGAACIKSLSSDGICTWDEAVQNMVDLKIVTRALDGLSSSTADSATTVSNPKASESSIGFSNASSQRKFSLWSTLFSNTFSSLVHSILSTSFHSVHRQVVATLRASLANAPSLNRILPHEAYRNTLRIATELDAALKKVSDDAHELLVHAEEREESERRLKQSLYVQTCEIMGRLLNELRRMLLPIANNGDLQDDDDAIKELIVGRLCYLLKFRLPSLPKLLDPKSSPAILSSRSGRKVGMITVAELQSAFEMSDVDDDGLINFEEAMEAMDGAFSGTQFHGAEMVRDTMLLSSGTDEKASSNVGSRATPKNLTLPELTLLSARGLRHDISGPGSSLGTIQTTLDSIVQTCFARWATSALSPHTKSFINSWTQSVCVSSETSDEEWKRLHTFNASEEDLLHEEISEVLSDDKPKTQGVHVGGVSSHVVSYLIAASALLNKSICPSDALPPFPSKEYATAMGISFTGNETMTMIDTLRSCLLIESFSSISSAIDKFVLERREDDEIIQESKLQSFSPSSLTQLLLDIKFVSHCFFKRNKYDLLIASKSDEISESVVTLKESLNKAEMKVMTLSREKSQQFDINECIDMFDSRYNFVYGSCSMFLTSILGEDNSTSASSNNKENIMMEESGTPNSAQSLILNPIPSSRRFTLLPIQAEQSVKELQLIRNLEKERAEKAENEIMSGASAAANAVSSGIGYFSSFLKKK